MTTLCLPVNWTVDPAQGLVIAGDPAAAADWPAAFIPAGLPAPTTPIRSLSMDITAHLPLTTARSVGMQVLDEPTGAVEFDVDGWSGAAGSNDPEPGVDYWRLTNWDTSTGVYGYRSLHSASSTSRYLDLGNHSDHWYGSSDFDVTFRFSRPDWLKFGDASYSKIVAQLWEPRTWGPVAWTVSTYSWPWPSVPSGVTLTFSVTGYGSAGVTLATLQAAGFAVDGHPDWFRCSRAGTSLTIAASHDGTTWTTVATGTGTGTPTDPGVYSLWVGGEAYSFWNGASVMDGTLTDLTYRVGGTLVADIGLDGAPSTSATSWTAPTTGRTVTRTGGTLLGGATGTAIPIFTFPSPTPLSDFIVSVPPIWSGEVTVDQICLDYITDDLVLRTGWAVGMILAGTRARPAAQS